MKYNKSVFKALALVTQFGISMLVPVALCVALGIWIDNRFGTWWTVPLIFVGMAAGGRNIYRMAMTLVRSSDKEKDEKDE